MVVNAYGRIDLFDITDPNQPAKITEIAADARNAAFTPKGTPRDKIRIVSGGGDGTLRLWTLDGKPASEPFKGHAGAVWSVAFSPDGAYIASAGGLQTSIARRQPSFRSSRMAPAAGCSRRNRHNSRLRLSSL